jgi:glucose/arabinose dehydrogenase
MTWLKLPTGFCAHYFGNVADARQLRFAPGGELFVASPTMPTTGGNPRGALAGIALLPDDNHDGIADRNIPFLMGLPSVQGLLFAKGAFYYQDAATIRSVSYHKGDRSPSAPPQAVTTITAPQDGLHWTKVMDVAMDGTLYVTNGGSQGEVTGNPKTCQALGPGPRGGIFAVQDGGATSLVAKGFRNPIALRCEANHNACLATELALDYSEQQNGREKLVPVRQGDDWGYSCCATKNLPYAGMTMPAGGTPDCSGVTPDTDSFLIGDTPFGVDFDNGAWPAPWGGRAYVTLHGRFGDWVGARVVTIALDPTTGFPLPGTDLDPNAGQSTLLDFASGWDDGTRSHGRPAPITFAADGRMFVGNDNDGNIVWIAPQTLQASWP